MNKEKEVEAYLKNELPEEEKLKYEIAQELGVLDKVLEGGWKSLSAKETGRIGGLLASKRKEEKDSCPGKLIHRQQLLLLFSSHLTSHIFIYVIIFQTGRTDNRHNHSSP